MLIETESMMEFADGIEEAGYDDILILQPTTFRNVLTDKRLEIIQELRENEFESERELAKSVDREPSAVQRDLKALFEADVIAIESEGNRKIPELKHSWLFVAPIDLRVEADE